MIVCNKAHSNIFLSCEKVGGQKKKKKQMYQVIR